MSDTSTEAPAAAGSESADLADALERAAFYEADRDRERLAAEHHRTAYAELEAQVRSAIEDHKFTLLRPGNGPAQGQLLEVVPVEALAGLLAPAGEATP